MNTFDFDQTVFESDSSYTFFIYCLKKHSSAVLRTLPKTAFTGLLYLLKLVDTKKFKESVFSFLKYLDDVDAVVERFWKENRGDINLWYYELRRDDDVIISASPEFLLAPIAAWLGVRLIATPMDKHSGKILGKNCHDVEKVRRFREEYPGAVTEKFYSDSLSDEPMARIAQRAYLVNKNDIAPWPWE